MTKPECRKCGLEHWRFIKCEDAKAEAARPKPAPHRTVVQREGERPWGDKFITLKRTGTNAFYSKEQKGSPHGGSVSYPPGFTPPGKVEDVS